MEELKKISTMIKHDNNGSIEDLKKRFSNDRFELLSQHQFNSGHDCGNIDIVFMTDNPDKILDYIYDNEDMYAYGCYL